MEARRHGERGCRELRALLLHSSETWFRAVKKALRNPPDPPAEQDLGECLVIFVSVEKGDTPSEAERLARDSIVQAERLGVGCVLIYPFAHLSSSLAEPRKAHEIILYLERYLRSSWQGKVARAPFGWYKSFRVHCIGHPLCELSREYRGSSPTVYFEGRAYTLQEAYAQGLIPLLNRGKWPSESSIVMARFGLEPLRGLGLEIGRGALVHASASNIGADIVVERSQATGDSAPWSQLVYTCLDIIEKGYDAAVYLTETSGEILSLRRAEPQKELAKIRGLMPKFSNKIRVLTLASPDEAAGQSGVEPVLGLPWYSGFQGVLYYYISETGRAVPLAAHVSLSGSNKDQSAFCIGPSVELAKALVDHGVWLAKNGITPFLPFWANPVHAAVIPVRDTHENFAAIVAKELSLLGLRVYLDPPTRGLGARIRRAGKLWALYVVVIGDREVETGTLSVRRRVQSDQVTLTLDELIDELSAKILSNPPPRYLVTSPPRLPGL